LGLFFDLLGDKATLLFLTAILIIKIVFFESPPTAGFQKKDLGVSSAFGAGNTQIVFIMRIAVFLIIKSQTGQKLIDLRRLFCLLKWTGR
jgi:hypothetical protein